MAHSTKAVMDCIFILILRNFTNHNFKVFLVQMGYTFRKDRNGFGKLKKLFNIKIEIKFEKGVKY